MLLQSRDALLARIGVASGPLAPLATSLVRELEPLRTRELYVPQEKALLSREGGRCATHDTYLEFDPFSPHAHRCPAGHPVAANDRHDRFWVFWYQLWLAERAVHGGLLAALGYGDELADLAARILDRYVETYLRYPNRDNVLGPTRLFFSTYLESIWLLNLCIAADLLEQQAPRFAPLGQRLRDRVLEPSATIIASYDEGASNRQVWNDAALLAAARLLGRGGDVEQAVFGGSGLTYHLREGLLGDGTWYEGENYHLFAHRGLWYGVMMAEMAGMALPADLVARFDAGFVAPFRTALPDMTLPSRRDSQYAISLRQPRFAELCELGIARRGADADARLVDSLRRLYADDIPARDTGRARSTADVERNLPATRLTRADLGWRSLAFALPLLPEVPPVAAASELLPAQGIAVLRRAQGRVYAALDYGRSGGGHGHPDRLNVLLSDGATRWLDDMGTGSYVDPSLHWYRSTLAHNAPLFDGYQQQRVDGELLAFDDRGDTGWVSARALDLGPGVATARSLVAMSDYLLDEMVWHAAGAVVMDLPIHVDPSAVRVRAPVADGHRRVLAESGASLDDALGLLRDVSARAVRARKAVRIMARDGERVLHGYLLTSSDALLYRATAPGPPGTGLRPFLVLRVLSPGGLRWVRSIWSWDDAVADATVRADGNVTIVERRDGSRDHHRLTLGGWRIERVAGRLRTSVDLAGRTSRRDAKPPPTLPPPPPAHRVAPGRPYVIELGREAYRRSEETWEEAGRPTARVAIDLSAGCLAIEIAVRKSGDLTFVPAGAVNPYDNEHPDVNGDGIQLYVRDDDGSSAWMLVPDPGSDSGVRIRAIDDWPDARPVHASWRRQPSGYALRATVSLDARRVKESPLAVGVVVKQSPLAVGIVVNEKPPDRERRRGQLVLGGRAGDFVYLRGDREDPDQLPRFLLTD